MLLVPMLPQPTMPITIRLDGAVVPSRPSALAGMNVGIASVVATAPRNRRRLIFKAELSDPK
jgi:hypothetical protein